MKKITKHKNFVLTMSIFLIIIFNTCLTKGNSTNQNFNFSEVKVALYESNVPWYEDMTAFPNLVEWVGCNFTKINSENIKAGILDEIDILIVPGGSNIYWEELGIEGKELIQNFINNGGAYMGFCAGAFYATNSTVWTPSSEAEPIEEDKEEFLELFDGIGIGPIYEICDFPGYAMTKITIETHDHMITKSLPDNLTIWYGGGGYFQVNENADVTILGTYALINKPAIICFNYGEGNVFLSGPHPEFEEDDTRDGLDLYDELDDVESDWPLLKQAIEWCATPSNDENVSAIPGYTFLYPFTIMSLIFVIKVKNRK